MPSIKKGYLAPRPMPSMRKVTLAFWPMPSMKKFYLCSLAHALYAQQLGSRQCAVNIELVMKKVFKCNTIKFFGTAVYSDLVCIVESRPKCNAYCPNAGCHHCSTNNKNIIFFNCGSGSGLL